MDARPRQHLDRIDTPLAGQMPSSLLRRALVDRRWHPVGPWRAPQDPCVPLPDDLRSWPASWRYRVAALEMTGLTRAVAMGTARREFAANTSLET